MMEASQLLIGLDSIAIVIEIAVVAVIVAHWEDGALQRLLGPLAKRHL